MDEAGLFCSVLKDEITKARAPETTEAGSGADRRRSFRHPLGAVGIILGEHDREPMGGTATGLQVMVFNVSIHGVGFRSPAAYAVGTVHRLRIGSGPLFVASRLRIVSRRARPDGMYDIGAEFY